MLTEYAFQIILTGLTVVIFFVLRLIFVTLVKKFAKKSERVEQRTGLIIKYINYTVAFLVLLCMFVIWGVAFSDVGVVFSSVFAVIGIAFFAQWSILSNITSGIIMFFTFPYKIGDYIIIHDKDFDYQGTVEDIKGFHIVIKTPKDRLITYPNSLIMQKGVSVFKPEEIPSLLDSEDKNLEGQTTD